MIKLDDLKTGHYKVTITVQWVTNAVRDYTVGLYGAKPVKLYECVGAGDGQLETPPFYLDIVDKCQNLLEGSSFKQGMTVDTNDMNRVNNLATLNPGLVNIGEVL